MPQGITCGSYVRKLRKRLKTWGSCASASWTTPWATSSLDTLAEKDRAAMIRARLGQGEFRDKLVRFWGSCAVTGCATLQLLVASHVKPWRDCDVSDARDLSNGLLLTPNLDRAFDLGYISFQDTGEIILSSMLTTQSASDLGVSANMRLQKALLAEQQHFMQYHRSNILLS